MTLSKFESRSGSFDTLLMVWGVLAKKQRKLLIKSKVGYFFLLYWAFGFIFGVQLDSRC